MNSRFAPRTTREEGASRVPMARSEWPEINGATSGSSALRSVERSTSMYASTGASESPHTVRSARPRPFSSSRVLRTPATEAASHAATSGVRSVLALSAIVMRKGYGKVRVRCSCSLRTQGPRSFSSLKTGITTSRTGSPGTGARGARTGRAPGEVSIAMPRPSRPGLSPLCADPVLRL